MRLADGNWLVFAGYFDPLTADIAERLHRLIEPGRHERVLAVILDGTEALLTLDARSTLMAALREVDAVVAMPESQVLRFVPDEPRIRFVFDRGEERRNTATFTATVLSKQRLAVHPTGKGR